MSNKFAAEMHTAGIRSEYSALLRAFLDEIISPLAFERQYLHKVKHEQRHIGGETNVIIQTLFGDVDAFDFDPQLYVKSKQADPDADDLTLTQLRECVQRAFDALQP